MRIEPVDPRDEDGFAGWFAVLDAVHHDTWPGDPGWQLGEQREKALAGVRPDAATSVPLLVAVEGDRSVGAARLELPLRDNLHLADLELAVLPAARRRGVGSALLTEAERLAAAQGRTTVIAPVEEPPALLGRSPGRAFALRHGYTLGQTEVRRDIALPLDAARVAALAATCASYADGYAVRTWRDRCPDDLLEDRAFLMRRMSTDAPSGGLDWQEEEWDGPRVRRREELTAAQGRTFWGAGAVHEASGRLVAFTEVGMPRALPARAYQWETLVLSEHRGRRLGTLVKLACLGAVAADSPATRYVSTWNAEENAPMIAVNDALGAYTQGTVSLWQRRLD